MTLPIPPCETEPITHASSNELIVNPLLARHLESWLGASLPSSGLRVIPWAGRDLAGWDGSSVPALGIEVPGATVLSLSPTEFPNASGVDIPGLDEALTSPGASDIVPRLLGRPDLRMGTAVFRYTLEPATLPEVGEWVNAKDPRLPDWLHPFNGEVLVAWDALGMYAAGVGRKQHNQFGHELSVNTAPGMRGHGLARQLVAQAARRVIADGAIPMYLHSATNKASARVADKAGFPDRGWRLIELR